MFCDHFLSFLTFQNVPFSGQQSRLIVFHTQVVKFSLFGDIDVHDFQGVFNEGFLDFEVQRSVSGKTGSVIDFEKNGFGVVFEHNIKSQNVKTHVSSVILRLAAFVLMAHDRKTCDNRLDYEVLDLVSEFLDIDALGFDLFHDTEEGSFVSYAHV